VNPPRTVEARPARHQLVAVLDRRGRFLTATPLFHSGRSITVEQSTKHRAGPGDLVVLQAGGQGRGRARIVRRLGRPDNARDVIEALMIEQGLARRFPPPVERAAEEAQAPDVPRRDLRDLPTFTIDPASAKDFDDAISAQSLEDGRIRVWVHIADVTAYVRPGSPIDKEAYRRATSVYVPSMVEPMLPERLSNGLCSLVPGQERLAVTVEMDFVGPTVVRQAFFRSLIRSDERLDYDRVDRILGGEEPALPPWAEPLAAAREVARALDERRDERGALAVESAEPEFRFDRKGQVVSLTPSLQTESHRLIEHLMIAANEQVAGLLEDRGMPALYRVHEEPDPDRILRLVDQLASLDIPTPPVPKHLTPSQATDLVGEISHTVADHVRRTGHGRIGLTSLVLRSLKQAYYSPKNLGHAGLRSPRYCHFTSPIRRYPDVLCHRALLSAIGGGEEPPARSGMEDAGAWTSDRERDAMKLERSADDVARCFLLERELFELGHEAEWEGEVTGVIGAGAFVQFGDGYEGLLPVRSLRDDWFELNEEGTILAGAKTGRQVKLGQPVRVKVDRVEPPRGRVTLMPAELT
jgi:ribonuclease R